MDIECYDGITHPEKPNEIWINIGTDCGVLAQLTMGYGEKSEDGFWTGYTVFDMNSEKEIDIVIAMLEESKKLADTYRHECWDELGLPPPDIEDETKCDVCDGTGEVMMIDSNSEQDSTACPKCQGHGEIFK